MDFKKALLILMLCKSIFGLPQENRPVGTILDREPEIGQERNHTPGITTVRHIAAGNSDEYTTYIRHSNADSLIRESAKKLGLISNLGKPGFSIDDFDKLITFDNEVLFVKVQHITLVDVRFIYPLNTNVESVNREKVSQIIYANGNIDLFVPFDEVNKDSLNYIDDRLIVHHHKSWESITVTENEKEMAEMVEIGPVNSVFVADRVQATNTFLEKNGLIILRRRAANLEADCILITKKTFSKGYGAYPSVKLEGTAYKYNDGLQVTQP